MLNVFPRAHPATIEELIGQQLPNSHPPEGQKTVPSSAPPIVPHFVPFARPAQEQDLKNLSEIESRLFPEPSYSEVRNAVIKAYRNAKGPLSLMECLHICEFPLLFRVFDFLEDHHFINHAVSAKKALDCLYTAQQAESIAHNGAGIPAPSHPETINEAGSIRTVKYRNIEREFLESAKCLCGRNAAFFTTDLFFVCGSCYEEGRYPSHYTSRNFHSLTPRLLQSLWTRHDELMLLKNIEVYGDNWPKVAESLGKTVEQCIFHFIKMPLLDDCTPYPLLPFSTVPNQVSTFISYVAYMVHPGIAAEMAKAAIKFLERPDVMDILIGVSVKKGKEILELEHRKRERIRKVVYEARVRCLLLKVDAINEMYHEGSTIRAELESARIGLVEDAKNL